MKIARALSLVGLLATNGSPAPSVAANAPATVARQGAGLRRLETGSRQLWRAYFERSALVRQIEIDAIAPEPGGFSSPLGRAERGGVERMPLERDASWYAGAEARKIAARIASLQTAAGGWGRNPSRDGTDRESGRDYMAADGVSGAVDSSATITEMRFLARVIAVTPPDQTASLRQSFQDGLTFLLASQYPNGGWPLVWPLHGGEHDLITVGGGTMLATVKLLGDVAEGTGDFAFVSSARRAMAKSGWTRGLSCLLASQTVVRGQPAGWYRQYDPLTLTPVAAHTEEPVLLTSETAEILLYLMGLSAPSPAVRRAIEGGARWMAGTAITTKAWPDVDAASLERPEGHGELTTEGAVVAAAYVAWRARH